MNSVATTPVAKLEHIHTAKILDIGGNVLKTDSKTFREQRSSLRAPQVQKWLDKTAQSCGGSAVKIEMEHRIGPDGDPGYDWFAVKNGKSSFLLEETNADPRNVALREKRDEIMRQRDAAEMKALLEPFAPEDKWIATGFAWDASHNLVRFTGERNREKKMFKVQQMRKTHRNYYIPAGKPIWVPQENIVTLDPMRRITDIGVLPSKSMYPYFNRLDNDLPADLPVAE